MMAPALSETEDRLWYHHQRALVDHLWMHFIICKSISLSVEVIFCAIQGGMQSVLRYTFKDLFQHFFLRVHLRYWKKVIGSAMPRRGGVSMHTFDNHEEFEFCETPGMKTVQHFLVLICALAATRGSTSLWESARPNNSPQRPWHALHCLSFWQISLSLQFDFTSQS